MCVHSICPEEICGKDIDDLFAYPTAKVVKIRDARLGLARIAIMFIIFLYVCIWRLWEANGYLLQQQPIGALRFSLKRPTLNDCDPENPACTDDFVALNKLPYCVEYPNPPKGLYQRNCSYFDEHYITGIQQSSLIINTRYTNTLEKFVCRRPTAAEHYNCPVLYEFQSADEFYIADVEHFTMLIDHSFQANLVGVNGNGKDYQGYIHVPSNNKLCASDPTADAKTAPCLIKPNSTSKTGNGYDIITVGTLFEVMGLDIDAGGNKSVRFTGTTVMVSIEYTNFAPWSGTGQISYVYKLRPIDHSSYKSQTLTDVHDQGSSKRRRTVVDAHGIRLAFLQSGMFGAFDFTTLLVQLTTSLTLFAVSTLIVDLMAMYFMPDKDLYAKYKFLKTVDFSEYRDGKEKGANGEMVNIPANDEDPEFDDPMITSSYKAMDS